MVQLHVIEDHESVIQATATRLTRDPQSWQEILAKSRNYDIEKLRKYDPKELGKYNQEELKELKKLEELKRQGIEKSAEYIRRVYEEYGHHIALEFGDRALVVHGISRISALFNWRNVNVYDRVYASGLERSMRIQKPPFECIDEKTGELYELGLNVYEYAVKNGTPPQDARYALPEGIKTDVIFDFPKGSKRYFAKLANAFDWPLEEHEELRNGLKGILESELNFLPKEKPLTSWKLKGTSNLKESIYLDENPLSASINIGLDASLSMFAQLVRERLGNTELEPFEQIVRRARFEVPYTFDEHAVKLYKMVATRAIELQHEAMEAGDARFVYYTLLGQKARSVFHVSGAGAGYVAGERYCGAAQWEIRNKVGMRLAKPLNIGSKCQEAKRCTQRPITPCLVKQDWPKMSSEEIFEKLTVPLQDFQIES